MVLKQYRLLVTPTSYGKSNPAARRVLEEMFAQVVFNDTGKPLKAAQLAELLPGIDGYIAGLDEINAAALANADRLKVISRYGVGVDNVDLDAARQHGIVVTNTPAANSISVAELTIGLILVLCRQIPAANEATHRGDWPRLDGVALHRKTVGIVGLGSIGGHVARRLTGFDCTLLGYDVAMDAGIAGQYNLQFVGMEEILERSDFVTLHVPLTEKTHKMVNDAWISRMKPGAFLINTSRGELVDETALLRGLQTGRLRGAGLDTFSSEPPDPSNPLLQCKQVILTPHTGAHTDDAIDAMRKMSTDDCLAVLSGGQPRFKVV